MTDEQINTRIAQIRGWDMDPEEAREWGSRGQWTKHPEKTSNELVSKGMYVPKYTEDLNVMRDVECFLDEDLRATYALFLHSVSEQPRINYLERDFDAIHATARQKAEAFLRTLDKWEVQT